MTSQEIYDLIVSFGPSLTAIITVISSLLISISKVKSVKNETAKELDKNLNETKVIIQKEVDINASLKYELRALIKENAELKKQISEILDELSPIKGAPTDGSK